MKKTLENSLNCIEIEPKTQAEQSVIWLHGLGASGHDFVPMLPELQLPATHAIRFIFPNAPQIPVTINHGMVMPAWYDIQNPAISHQADEAGIMQSINAIDAVIQQEIARGISPKNIVLGGFSQGAAMALMLLLTHQESLAGVLALSGYLPMPEKLPIAHPANLTTPVFLAHGTDDPIVPYALGKASHRLLKNAGYAIEWQSYPMAHAVCPEEISDISRFIQQAFANPQ